MTAGAKSNESRYNGPALKLLSGSCTRDQTLEGALRGGERKLAHLPTDIQTHINTVFLNGHLQSSNIFLPTACGIS